MYTKKQELANILNEFDVSSPRESSSRSSDTNAFADVASFLNIHSEPTTLFELKKEFTSHSLLDDVKLNNDITQQNQKNDEEDDNDIYQKEQFLTFIHSGDSINIHDNDNNNSIPTGKISRQYSLSSLSKSIIKPNVFTIHNHNDNDNDPSHLHLNISTGLDQLKKATSVPLNIFADPTYICSSATINWKFGFVTTCCRWRPEFIDVIKFKQFNLTTASKIFKNGKRFKKPSTHSKWKNLYWFFDNRSSETRKSQKNDRSGGMKQYLNDYKDGIIVKFNTKYNICHYDQNKCFEIIGDDDAINKNMCCGVLRAYCNCDVVEWKYNNINRNKNVDNILCISCNKKYQQDKKEEKEAEKEREYWIEGISRKHNNLSVYLCGKCIIELVIEGTDQEQIDIYSYLTDSLTNNRKITELCLVHRLFATSSQLMQLLINSFCQNFELNETAGTLKVINFCIKWVNFLWFEDFATYSKCRLLLNKFISFLLQQTNGKNEYLSIYKATQKLIKTYRDQYALQKQLNSELEALVPKSPTLQANISSKIMLQNSLNNYFSDSQDSDEETNYFRNDLFNCEMKDIPSDLSWYEVIAKKDEKQQKFFNYILQKRNSIHQFRTYESKEIKQLKKCKTLQVTHSNEIDFRLNKSMPFKSVKNKNKNQNINEKKKKPNSNALNVIKSYEVQHTKSAFSIFGANDNSESIFLLDHCCGFAQQITLIAFDLFAAIRPTELLRKAWTKKDKYITAPNIAELIIFMESITIWAKFEIVVEFFKFRKKTVEKICRIGIELLSLGNIYGAVQIYLALISTDLRYFKNDLQILTDNIQLKEFMQKIAKLIDHSRNHASLRASLWSLSAPAIPYLGVFLKDAFQADELLKISKLQKVNPKQMELLFNVYDKIELFRNVSYTKIKRNNIIITYIHRQLYRAKKLNVKHLSKFCKEQSVKEHASKRGFWG